MAKILTVDKSKARLPWEEYEHIRKQQHTLGRRLVWDMHPNQIAMEERVRKRLEKKLCALVDSEEFQYYNPWYEH